VKITPAHNAVLSYAEWCCDNGRPWPKLQTVADDMAWSLQGIQAALRDLLAWQLVSIRCGQYAQTKIIRLGDGRETISHVTPVIHSNRRRQRKRRRNERVNMHARDARIAA